MNSVRFHSVSCSVPSHSVWNSIPSSRHIIPIFLLGILNGWLVLFLWVSRGRKTWLAPWGATEKALKVFKVCLTFPPSDWFPCLDQLPHPPPPLPPLRNSLPRYSLPLFYDHHPFLVPPGFWLHPGGDHKHTAIY